MIHKNMITVRTRLLLFIVPSAILLFLGLVGYIVFMEVVQDGAKRLARQYSIEAASNFQLSIHPHRGLMQQLSRSYTIARWMEDSSDESKREAAFNEITQFHSFSPTTYLMFTSKETLLAYTFEEWEADRTIADFKPWGRLAGGEVSRWFYDTIESPSGGTVNVQGGRDNPVDGPYFWMNQSVELNGKIVGVVTVGFDFSHLFDTVFGNFDSDYRNAYVVDNEGRVRADSNGNWYSLFDNIQINRDELGTEGRRYLDEHLRTLNAEQHKGVFGTDFYVSPFVVDTERYSFGSISPIIDTPWSVVVLSNHLDSIYDFTFVPLIVAGLGILVFVMLVGSYVMKRTIVDPLYRLTKSTENAEQDEDIQIYGIKRNDEIGYLARTIEIMRNNIKNKNQEMRKFEVIEESNRAKTRFLTRMSHEIRTPISAVLGIAEVQLKIGELTPPVEEAFSKVYTSGNLLLNIVNDILDLSRIESGKMELSIGKYEVMSMVSDVMQRYVATADKKDLEFNVRVDKELPFSLMGDIVRIEQVMNNLISNAFKYTVSGGVLVEFNKEESLEENKINLVIKVTDTGLGMSQEQLDVIFNEYARFHESEYRNIDGTGLGMPIVYNLTDLMGANLDIESELGKGTKITINIPQEIFNGEPLGEQRVQVLEKFKENRYSVAYLPSFEPEPMPYGKILLVDDLEVNLYVAEEILQMYNVGVIEKAFSGAEAVEKVRRGGVYDVIFMDHMMPGMDGLETLQKLREMNYNEPIIALTANAMIGQEDLFKKNGFQDFMSKPIQTKRLHELLLKYVKEKYPPEVRETAIKQMSMLEPNKVNEKTEKEKVMHKKILSEFVSSQKNAVENLREALEINDTKVAHIIVHSLKSVSGLIGERKLVEISSAVEGIIRENKKPKMQHIIDLETELTEVIEKVKSITLNGKSPTEVLNGQEELDNEEVLKRLQEIQEYVESNNVMVLDVLPEIEHIPQLSVLVKQLDDLEFRAAEVTLKTLIQIFEESAS